MRITMKDFFDNSDRKVHTDFPSTERVKVLTLKKINNMDKASRRVPRIAVIAAVMAVIFTFSVVAYAVTNWTGFMNTQTMSEQEIQELIDMIENSGGTMIVDEEKNVHFYDNQGSEVIVLSAIEARKFERERQKEKAVRNEETAGHLLNVKALDVMPRSITPIETDETGYIDSFLLSNGNMVVLHEQGENGYQLEKGDTVIIHMETTGECIVEFGVARGGNMQETVTMKQKVHEFVYTADKDGLYCFTVMYYSASADNFTNCSITMD